MKTLKYKLIPIMLIAITTMVHAQKQPSTFEFEVEGMKVILRESVKGTVSARLFVMGGAANYAKAKEGIEPFALSLAADAGPEGMTRQEYNAAAEAVGASISADAGYDYANLSLNCLELYWDKSWELFAKTVVNPAFRQDDFNILQEQLVAASKQNMANPDSYLRELAMSKTWAGTDYEKIPDGTPESLQAIELEDVKKHYSNVITKKNTFLVVVGKISEADLREKIKASLAKLPEGKAPQLLAKSEKINEGLFVEDRDIETNYILGQFDAPAKGSEESVYNSLAMSILYKRFFEELRTKRSLSYAPAALASGMIAHPMNMVYISTTDPKASLEVMVDEVNKAKKSGFTEAELEGKKQGFLTNYYMGQETNSSISMTLGINEINGSWELADKFTAKVLAAKVTDLNDVMQKYGDKISWTYLGKEEMVKPEDFKQPVKLEVIKK